MPFWHPKGMVIWNVLEDLRRRENAKRGYVEVKTPLMYDVETWKTSGHWEKFKDEMFLVPYGEERTLGLKPMNCPGHMLLFGSALRSYRELPLRYAEASTLHRNERGGHAARPAARPARHPGRRAHLRHARADRGRDLRRARLRGLPLRPLRHRGALRALDATREQARHRRGVGLHRGRARARRSSGAGSPFTVNEGDGAFYGPKIDLHMTDVLGRSWQMGTIQLDSQMPARFGLTYMGADNAEHTPYVDPPRALRLARALHRDPDRALRRRVPVLARAGADADPPGRRRSTASRRARAGREAGRVPRRGGRARRDRRQADPRRRGREDPGHDRLRRQGVGRRRSRSASAAESSRPGRWTNFARTLLRFEPAQAGAQPSPPEPSALPEVQPSRRTRISGRCLQRFCR